MIKIYLFLGKSDPKATSNATSLEIMLAAIEEIYYEMLNKRQINELAEWIQFDECKEVEVCHKFLEWE